MDLGTLPSDLHQTDDSISHCHLVDVDKLPGMVDVDVPCLKEMEKLIVAEQKRASVNRKEAVFNSIQIVPRRSFLEIISD